MFLNKNEFILTPIAATRETRSETNLAIHSRNTTSSVYRFTSTENLKYTCASQSLAQDEFVRPDMK